MSLSSSDMDGLYLLCICVWSHGPDPRTGFLNCAEIWRWSKNKFQCRYKMPSSLTWRSLTGYGGQNETRLRFLKTVVSVSSRYGLLWLTSDSGRIAYGACKLQVQANCCIQIFRLQSNSNAPTPAVYTRPSAFKKEKFFSWNVHSAKVYFRREPEEIFCSTGICLLSFESYCLEIQDFSDQVKVGLARQTQHQIFVHWICQTSQHELEHVWKHATKIHATCSVWVFRNGAKKTCLVHDGNNFLCVFVTSWTGNLTIRQYKPETRTELNCQSFL